jgi:hypothetical protein
LITVSISAAAAVDFSSNIAFTSSTDKLEIFSTPGIQTKFLILPLMQLIALLIP